MMKLSEQQLFLTWMIDKLRQGMEVSGIPESQIENSFKYASQFNITDFYKEQDPFNIGGTNP